jgi:hypothetical protein
MRQSLKKSRAKKLQVFMLDGYKVLSLSIRQAQFRSSALRSQLPRHSKRLDLGFNPKIGLYLTRSHWINRSNVRLGAIIWSTTAKNICTHSYLFELLLEAPVLLRRKFGRGCGVSRGWGRGPTGMRHENMTSVSSSAVSSV